jgi:hypothetical protein
MVIAESHAQLASDAFARLGSETTRSCAPSFSRLARKGSTGKRYEFLGGEEDLAYLRTLERTLHITPIPTLSYPIFSILFETLECFDHHQRGWIPISLAVAASPSSSPAASPGR